jgi:hypothetical protein
MLVIHNQNIMTENNVPSLKAVVEQIKGQPKKSFFYSGWWTALTFVLFGLLYLIVAFVVKPQDSDIGNEQVLEYFDKFSPYAGFVFGLLLMIVQYLLHLVKIIVRLKYKIMYPVILFLSSSLFLALAIQFVYFEKRYTDIARGVIDFIGYPLFYATIITCGLALIWLIVKLILHFVKKK